MPPIQSSSPTTPNPKRVLAGRLNRSKRGPLTAAGREKLRQSALARKFWLQSTGPKTAEGKARSAANGKLRQKGAQSVRQTRAELNEISQFLDGMGAARRLIGG